MRLDRSVSRAARGGGEIGPVPAKVPIDEPVASPAGCAEIS